MPESIASHTLEPARVNCEIIGGMEHIKGRTDQDVFHSSAIDPSTLGPSIDQALEIAKQTPVATIAALLKAKQGRLSPVTVPIEQKI